MRSLCLVLALITFSAVAAPPLSAELPVDGQVIATGSRSADLRYALASNGSEYMAAWLDSRNFPYEVRVTRISAAGAVLDPTGVLVDSGHVYIPGDTVGIASDGTNFFVAFTGLSNGNQLLYVLKLDAQANVVAGPLTLSSKLETTGDIAIGWDGTNVVVGWGEDGTAGPGTRGIRAVRLTPALTVRDSTPITVATDSTIVYLDPRVACITGACLFTFVETQNGSGPLAIRAARLDTANGALLDAAPLTLGTNGKTPSVATNGSAYLVAWEGPSRTVYAARVSGSGAVVDSPAVQVATATGTLSATPFALFDGQNYEIAYLDSPKTLHRLTLSSTLSVTADQTTTLPRGGFIQRAAAAVLGGNVMTIAVGGGNIYGAINTVSGAFGALFPVNTIANPQTLPIVATDGTTSLYAWLDGRDDFVRVYAARATAQGAVDLAGVPLTPLTTVDVLAAAIAFDGTNYFLAWSEGDSSTTTNRTIRGAFLSPTLQLQPPGIFTLAQNVNVGRLDGAACVSGNGCSALYTNETGGSNLMLGLVSSSGTVMSPKSVGNSGIGAGRTLTSNGAQYNVTARFGNELQGSPVSPTGTISTIYSLTTTAPMNSVKAASDGRNFFVAWDSTTAKARAARVSAGGQVIDTTPIFVSSAAPLSSELGLAFDGTRYVLAWSELASKTSGALRYATLVPDAGALSVDGGELWLAQDDGAANLALASFTGGELSLAYSRSIAAAPYGTTRVFLRWAQNVGMPDGGVPDAGSAVDAGEADAGVIDGGIDDAGTSAVPDAGLDAGTPGPGNRTHPPASSGSSEEVPSGCGCSTAADVALVWVLLAAASVVSRRRRG